MKVYITRRFITSMTGPHIGHVYTTTIAGYFCPVSPLCGDDVFFLTGTDEHAAKVVDSAAQKTA